MISEVFTGHIDYYQARAEAGPVATFEGDYFRDWVISGDAEKIPMFSYVYHDYGPLRIDGWAKLSPEFGDIFYWIGSRVTLWGGLFELNYEFSLLEQVAGKSEPPGEHYAPIAEQSFSVDPQKAAFVGEFARARVGFGNQFLAYGRMLPPVELKVPTIEVDWYFYNGAKHIPSFGERGVLEVDSVIHSAWRSPDECLGLFFVNIGTEPTTIELMRSHIEARLPESSRGYEVCRMNGDGEEILDPHGDTMQLTLPPRRIELIRACRKPGLST